MAQNSRSNGLPSISGFVPTKFNELDGSFCPTILAEAPDHDSKATATATMRGDNLFTPEVLWGG